MALKREYGQEQPYIPAGIFKIRIPFIHVPYAIPELIQGVLMVATPMSMTTCIMHMLGCPFELAMLIVCVHNFFYHLHPLMGDPVWPGAVTPSVALAMAWGSAFPAGTARIHAAIALQLTMAVIYLIFGITGLAGKLMSIVPKSMVAGVLLGAGISSVNAALGKQMVNMEFTVLIGVFIGIITMYSLKFHKAKQRVAFFRLLGKYGLLPGILGGMLVGALTGEITWPASLMANGLFLPFHRYPELFKNYTLFGVGFPPIATFLQALPMAITVYIISFSDFIFAEQITKTADLVRDDEIIDFNSNRSNLICAIRNFFFGFFGPYTPTCGPLWGGGVVSVVERYKQGRNEMESIFSGLFPFITTMSLGLIFMPIVSFFRPTLPLSLAMTFVIQGYASGYIAMDTVHTQEERGVAVLMAIILAFKGALWALPAGILLHLLVGVPKENKNEEQAA